MRKINRKISRCLVILTMAASILLLSACGSEAGADTENNKLQVVATIFPEYDWVKEILGQQAGKYRSDPAFGKWRGYA